MSGRRFLVVARVGDNSLHPHWMDGQRTFDVAVDYYGNSAGRWSQQCDFYHANKGGKWPGLTDLLASNPHYTENYDAVWFPDDDIDVNAATVNAMFALHDELGLALSQPALTPDSYYSHLATVQHPGFAVRYTNFVEVMAPLFSRAALQRCLPTFAQSVTGWGLDLVWSAVLGGSGARSAILDCTPVRHTRPVGTGDLYRKLGIDPMLEMFKVATRHGMFTPHPHRTTGGLDDEFRPLSQDDVERRLLDAGPHPTQQRPLDLDTYPRELIAGLRPRPAVTS